MLNLLVALHGALGIAILASGERFGRRALAIGVLGPALTLLYLLTRIGQVLDHGVIEQRQAWIPELGIDLDVRLDGFALVMALLVSGIGVAVFAYAWRYLPRRGPAVSRLIGLLTLFAGSMLGLVLTDNVITLFAYWELTSITSYLLIGNDHEQPRARGAALQALLVTGTGGLVMLGGLVVLGHQAGTYSMSAMLRDPPGSGALVGWALAAVLVGAFTKSAAYPFHAWLPGAMVAPTPISAYLHSATMVKAGIVLVARFAPAFAQHPIWQPLVVTVGLVTMILAGMRALRQFDLKLLLAHGTVSQLGFLFVLFGLGDPNAALAGCAMLIAHALFKATLFMVVGIIDHETGTRDLRALSRLGRGWWLLEAVAVIAALSMAGTGIVLGFVAKELALDALLDLHRGAAWAVVAGVSAGSVLTAAYSTRFVWGVLAPPWSDPPNIPPARAEHAPALAFVAPALVLTACTLLGGFAPGLLDRLVERQASSLDGSIDHVHLALWHGVTAALLLSLAIVAAGLVAGWRSRHTDPSLLLRRRMPSGDGLFLMGLRGVNHVADRVTAAVQSGSLPMYGTVILLTASVLPTVALLAAGTPFDLPEIVSDNAHVPLVAMAIGGALAAGLIGRRFAAAIFLGTVGYAMAGLFLVQGAPDLALTQVVFESLSTVLFMLVLRQLPDAFDHRAPRLGRAVRAVVAASVGAMVFVFMIAGAQDRPVAPVSTEMIERAYPDGGGRNVVNVILVDFRGFDTMGEITVLCVAAIGAVALARASHRSPMLLPDAAGGSPLIVELPVRLIFHALLIGSVFALFAGHNQPGGGFVGGLLAGTAIALRFVAGGMPEVRRVSRFRPWTVLGSGLLLSVATALAPGLWGRPTMESLERAWEVPLLGTVKASSTLLFDLGVYLVVVGLVLMVFEAFGDERVLERAA